MKSKAPQALPGKDLYTSELFRRRRDYAESSGAAWFIVSARWGLVAPDEVIAPYDVYLPTTPTKYRAAWGEFVAAQLVQAVPLSGRTVEIHAGDAYVQSLRGPLERCGALVVDAVDVHSFGETLAWYEHHSSKLDASSPIEVNEAGADSMSARSASVIDEVAVEAAVRDLTSSSSRLTVRNLDDAHPQRYRSPGMYSWWVDTEGAERLSKGLGHSLCEGLIYAGQAGATRWPSGKRSANTLWGRVVGMHLGARADLSTFRLTLGAVLHQGNRIHEDVLTRWMTSHLSVIMVPFSNGDVLDRIETEVLMIMDPPLNLAKSPETTLRRELTRLRKATTNS